jgi:hypothetical protein
MHCAAGAEHAGRQRYTQANRRAGVAGTQGERNLAHLHELQQIQLEVVVLERVETLHGVLAHDIVRVLRAQELQRLRAAQPLLFAEGRTQAGGTVSGRWQSASARATRSHPCLEQRVDFHALRLL